MEAKNLIKKRLAFLKEKELQEGLTKDEKLEIGRLYITDELNDTYEQIAILKKQSYWKERCLLAERCLFKSLNNDVGKHLSYNEYDSFINQNKEPE